MRRYWYLAIAGVIASALAILPLSAFAASGVLTVGSTSGPAVANGDTLTGTLSGSAKFVNKSNSNQFVKCTTSTIKATAGNNPPPIGVATASVTSQTFGSCSINGVIGATGVNSLTTNASPSCPWPVTIDDSTNPATVTVSPATGAGCPGFIEAVTVINTVSGQITCKYRPLTPPGTISGTAPLGSSAGITFTNQEFDLNSGPGLCFSKVLFTATYTFTDDTQGGGAVFAN